MTSKTRALILTIVVLWAVLLTGASLSSNNFLRVGISRSVHSRQITVRRKHRIAHCTGFGVLAFLLTMLGRKPSQKWAALVCVVALGAMIESLQHLIYQMPFETWDLRDDAYGAVAGFLGAFFLAVFTRKNKTLAI